MLKKTPKQTGSFKTDIMLPAVERIATGIRAAKNSLLGKIETPSALVRELEKNRLEMEKFIPFLPDNLKEQQCGDIDLSKIPSTNPLVALIESPELRMKAEADERFKLCLWHMVKVLTGYIASKQSQSVRIESFFRTFVAEYKVTQRKDIPALLRSLCGHIGSIA